MAVGPDEHFVDGGDEHFPKGLVGLVVLVEYEGGNFMGVLKAGDLGARRDRWDGGIGAGLTVAMKAVAESVAYMTGKTVSCRSPSVPHPRFDCTDAAFEFNFK